ncbi:MAG: M12 family metallo-peptidase [Saprospiraceae bacterium]
MLSLVLGLSATNAQPPLNFIEESPVSIENLTGEQAVLFERLVANPDVADVQLVSIRNLASVINSEGTVQIEIPGSSCDEVTFQTQFSEYKDSAQFVWQGELKMTDTCGCTDGSLIVVAEGGKRFGQLALEAESYEIHDLGQGIHALARISQSATAGNDCEQPSESNLLPGEPTDDRTLDHCEVRILILYNQSAVVHEGSHAAARNRALLAFNQTKIALSNSRVFENELRLVLAGIDSVAYSQTNANSEFELASMASDSAMQAMRDALGADIVALLTGDDYVAVNANGDTSDIRGRAGSLSLNDTLAYVLVEIGQATTSKYTFAHEVAHIFGCRHEFAADATPGIMHGHKFEVGRCSRQQDRYTIMHTVSVSTPRILHYSNPNVIYAGKRTGTTDREHNADQLRSTACTVADFRDSNNSTLSISIDGSNLGCFCTAGTFEAVITGGTSGTYGLAWSTSTDGVNYGPTLGTQTTFQAEYPCEVGKALYIKLTVTDPNQQVFTHWKRIIAVDELDGQACPQPKPAGNTVSIFGGTAVSVFPNPSTGAFSLTYRLGKASELAVSLHSIDGKFAYPIFRGHLPPGEHSFQPTSQGLPNGTYLVRFQTDRETVVRRLSIQNNR